jgi:2-oxo-4-hydroxy-4-carboxy-5-ureidoimidazoline decarboxylase
LECNVINYAMDSNAVATQTAAIMTTRPCPPIAWSSFDAMDELAFGALLGPVVEHSPWVAQRAWAARPFADRDQLFQAMAGVILGASRVEQLALLRSHPELAGHEARQGTMTADSQSEQGRLGLTALDAHTVQRIEQLNRRYRERFGVPFIVALRLHANLASVLRAFERRLQNDVATELGESLQEVCEVMRGRLNQTVLPPSAASSTSSTPIPTLSGSPS